jgi:spermidine synthase
MIFQTRLAEVITPDGLCLALFAHGDRFSIRVNGQVLMDSSATASETLLGELAVDRPLAALNPAPRVLIGGLGLGFTLRRVLAGLGSKARVVVAELMPEVVAWNRTHLSELNGHLVADPRVTLKTCDVNTLLGGGRRGRFDVILLDVDNGPVAMVQRGNRNLYSHEGIARIADSLKPGGRVAVWSAARHEPFADRLATAGFAVEAVPARVHDKSRRHAHVIYVADRVS